MSEHTAESKPSASLTWASWSAAESQLSIHYPLELLDEIRLAVSSSFHANPRGAGDVAGVFFGTRDAEGVRVTAWRPISREHSQEASFVLSEKDMADLALLLDGRAADTLLQESEPVGWFVPHARGSLSLTEGDLRVFNQFFPHPWQFTLVLQPALLGPLKAAFFVRSAEGAVSEHSADREFTLDPLRAARVHGQARRNAANEPGVSPPDAATARRDPPTRGQGGARERNGIEPASDLVRVRSTSINRRPQLPPLPRRDEPRAPVSTRKYVGWLLAIPVAGALIYGAMLVWPHFIAEPPPATLSLKLQDWPGAQLHVDWAKDSQPIQVARHGEIVIEDAGKTRIMDLDASQLRLGTFAYARRSGYVKIKLSVYGENNTAPAIEEVAEFNGSPPDDATSTAVHPSAAEQAVWAKQKADLEAEIRRLRGQLGRETAKTQELEAAVRALEKRLHLAPGK